MRNDVSFPPDPNAGDDVTKPAATTPAARRAAAKTNGRAAGATPARPFSPDQASRLTHPHTPDRAHSLERTRDKPATDVIYDMPEARGGIDSTTLSIVVVVAVAAVLLFVAWLVFRNVEPATPAPQPTDPPAASSEAR